MKKATVIDKIVLVLAAIGGLNLLIGGLFNFDFVNAILVDSGVTRVANILIGAALVYLVVISIKQCQK